MRQQPIWLGIRQMVSGLWVYVALAEGKKASSVRRKRYALTDSILAGSSIVSTSATLFQPNTMPSRMDAFEALLTIARRNASRFDSDGAPYTDTARVAGHR